MCIFGYIEHACGCVLEYRSVECEKYKQTGACPLAGIRFDKNDLQYPGVPCSRHTHKQRYAVDPKK